MAKSIVFAHRDNDVMRFVNTSTAILSGDVIVSAGRILIALVDIAATTGVGAAASKGTFNLKKKTADVLTQGEKLYWDDTLKEITETGAGNTFAGIAHKAADGSATTVDIDINIVVGT